MKTELKKAIWPEIKDALFIKKANQLFSRIKIHEIQKERYGNPLRHKDGTLYAIVIFNAYSQKGMEKVNDAITLYPKISISDVFNIVESNRLWKWFPITSKRLKSLNKGDICNVMTVFDEEIDDLKVSGFGIAEKAKEKIEPDDNFSLEDIFPE
jgi:hypothetical protein